ncbi:21 kDa protein-like [Humulus lupulus]|uniref:21 kDa protein-like n=1 Tax=Humulus lupulus TaxID=3486 RepID=UPI002B40E7D0|nr:21 kDa protein-like [Humulus lupulus]
MKISGLAHVAVAVFVLQYLCNQTTPISAISTFPNQTYFNYIKTSCNVTIYPRLCYESLSVFAENIKTNPKLLASTALNVTLEATKTTSAIINRLSRVQGLSPIEAAAVQDCVEVIGDSLDELQKSVCEMGQLGSYDFAVQISDIQTWVSAALTDDDTCVDGFSGRGMDGHAKATVRNHVLKVAHLTSNALALVNSYASLVQAALLP